MLLLVCTAFFTIVFLVMWGQFYSRECLSCQMLFYKTIRHQWYIKCKQFTVIHALLHSQIQAFCCSVKSCLYYWILSQKWEWTHCFKNNKSFHQNDLSQKQHERKELILSEETISKWVFFFFARQALFDSLSGITRLTLYWSEVPKGMWHHYEAWPYHLLPWSLSA